MRVSIKDIAREADVSHSTVSRALANSPLIAEETRRHIHRLARRMGYTPNAIARGLVMQRTKTVGVIVTTIEDPFVSEVVRGIEEVAGDSGYRVFLGTSHNDSTREMNVVKALREWRVDGVIVASSRVGALYQPHLKEIGAPIVLINNQNQHKSRAIHSVAVDDAQGGAIATRHLISLGSPRYRLSGWTCRLHCQRQPPRRLPARARRGKNRVRSGARDSGHRTRRKRRAGRTVSRAVAAADGDFLLQRYVRHRRAAPLKARGVRVPEDISLVGFDDIPFASCVDPPLTTIRQPKYEMGQRAMRMLLHLLNRKRVDNVMLPGELVVRESTRAILDSVVKPALA